VQVNVFLMADAVSCAVPGQNTPQGYYNIERMLKSVLTNGGKVKACGTCTEARGIREIQLVEGSEISNIAELARWTVDADKVLTF
jgi:uncharacterized protein involved in oxidation of intracellular sulfur